MDKEYDVVIIGAGPTGCQLARFLAKDSLDVLLIEKQNEIGEPNFSTAGTTKQVLKDFDLPHSVVAPYYWDNIYIETPGVTINKKLRRNGGYVFDFRKLKQWMAEDAAKHNATLLVGTKVKDVLQVDGKIVGVTCDGAMFSGEIRSKIVVDASGNGFLAYKLGMANAEDKELAIGLELEMVDVKFPQKSTLYHYLGDNYIPNGYGWVFPLNDTTAKVGIARYMPFAKEKLDLDEYLQKFIQQITWLKKGEPLELHGGSINFNSNFKDFALDNFLAIGSSSSQINPLGGEGIRHGLWAAKYAAKIIKKCLEAGDTSKKALQEFNEVWLRYSKDNWAKCYIMTRQVYANTDNETISNKFGLLNNLSGDQLFDILFNYNFNKYEGKIVNNIRVAATKKIVNGVRQIFGLAKH